MACATAEVIENKTHVGSCEVCGSPSSSFCRNCGVAHYCCKEHQKSDWKQHKRNCHPVKLHLIEGNKEDEILDLVCTRDILPNEMLLKEEPLVVFPYRRTRTPFVCVECCKVIKGKPFPCEDCGWKLCSMECKNNGKYHPQNECKLFASKGIKLNTPDPTKLDPYFIIGLVRCLLLKDKDPMKWVKLNKLNHFRKQRTTRPDHTEVLESYYAFLRDRCGLDQFDPYTVNVIFGILRGNAIDLSDYHSMAHDRNISFLFPRAMQTGRSCIPNARFSIHGTPTGNFTLAMFANVNIPKDSPINVSFEQGLTSTFVRRSLKERLFFRECVCERCKDPTELGTYLAAIKCKSCKEGYCLQTNPTDLGETMWKCNKENCPQKLNDQEVGTLIQEVSAQLQNADNGSGPSPMHAIEGLLKTIQYLKKKTLHPNHFILVNTEIDICKRLIELSGMVDVTEKAPAVVEMGKHLIQIVDVLSPGQSRLRGHVLYFIQFGTFYDIIREDRRRNKNSHSQTKSQTLSRRLQKGRKERVEEFKKRKNEIQKIFEKEPQDSEEAMMLTSLNEMILD